MTQKTVRILIVEDEMIIAEDLSDILSGLGYEVVDTAISAREALQVLEEKSPDLALVDIRLKGGKGFYRMQVRDNGRGIPRELDLENHRSLGLKLVRSLTRQLHGRFDITPETKGTSFTVEFRDISLVA